MLRELARSYLTIVKDLTRVMCRWKAVYRSWAIPGAGRDFVIAKVADAMGTELPNGDERYELISDRIEVLVRAGRLEAQGNTKNWRFSEVRGNLYNARMQAIPWSTIALGSLLLISAYSKGGQEVQSPQLEKSKPPVKMEQRGRILGIGGVFLKSANRDQMREWYSKHLGLTDKGEGAMLPWREHDDPQKEHVTVWTVFPTSTDYFDPSHASFMVNYIVDDLDALLDRLKQEGVKIDAKRMNESYGRFAWIYDLDGNKIELWQPPSAKP
jgi:catechol 2,3-dioxygenase-like lactoylglutathione lyase family enzyme